MNAPIGPMYEVVAISVNGKGNRIFKTGEIVPFWRLRNPEKLRENGFIKYAKHANNYKNGSDIRLCFVTMIYDRFNIFEIWAKNIAALQSKFDCKIDVIVAGSQGMKSKNIVESYGFDYIERDNFPLSNKANQTIVHARNKNPHYVFCTGSDNIICERAFSVYMSHMMNRIDYIGMTDLYFLNSENWDCKYWPGYNDFRKGKSIGAGRCLSAYLLHQLNWMPWGPNINKRLDYSMDVRIKQTHHTKHFFSIKENDVFACDIKSETNINSWDSLPFMEPYEFDPKSILI